MTADNIADNMTDNMQGVLKLIRETNDLIEEIRRMAQDENVDLQHLETQMDKLTQNIETIRQHPADTWQQARNDIMGLSANLDNMQKTLTQEYEKAKDGLTALSRRAMAEKSYAVYNQTAANNPNTNNEEEK